MTSQTDRIHELQRRDPSLADIIDYLEHDTLPSNNQSAKTLLHTIDDYYLDRDGLLCHIWTPGKGRLTTLRSQLVVPTALRHEILLSVHDSPLGGGHLGVHKTYEKVRERYYWRGLFADVQHWCISCVHCAMKKSPKNRPKTPLLPIPVEGPFDMIGVDAVDPFSVTKSGNRYLIVYTDYLTKWPEWFAVPTIDAPVVADLLVNEIIRRHGAPRKLLSDRGTNFLSKLIHEVCLLVNTEKVNTTDFIPNAMASRNVLIRPWFTPCLNMFPPHRMTGTVIFRRPSLPTEPAQTKSPAKARSCYSMAATRDFLVMSVSLNLLMFLHLSAIIVPVLSNTLKKFSASLKSTFNAHSSE